MQKTFVIGDVHGCHQTLLALLAKTDPDPRRDLLVFLGDYIDRGPDSKGVMATILELQKRLRVICLMGNHEKMLLDALAGLNEEYYLAFGGAQTLRSYGIPEPPPAQWARYLPLDHLRFFNELLPYWEDNDYIFVHAGLKPGRHLSQQAQDHLLWIRDEFVSSRYDFGKRVIFGHTPFTAPRVEPNKIGIDTGAVYGGKLTCLILPDLVFVQVPGPIA